jgi:hypothetical protein
MVKLCELNLDVIDHQARWKGLHFTKSNSYIPGQIREQPMTLLINMERSNEIRNIEKWQLLEVRCHFVRSKY